MNIKSPLFVIALTYGVAPLQTLAWPALPTERVRPANFYSLVTSNNSAVCTSALTALNKKYVVPIEENPPDLDRGPAKFLLSTDKQVHWHTVAAGSERFIQFATVDFQNNGRHQTIYRIPFMLDSHYGETVGTSAFDPGNLEDGTLTPDAISQKIDQIERAPGSLSQPEERSTPQWKIRKDAPRHIGSPSMLFMEVVALSEGTYMLATSAFEAQQIYEHYAVLKDYQGKPRGDVYLLQYIKDGDIPMICHFSVRMRSDAKNAH